MTDAYISSISTDADMDIIGRCVEANFSMLAETCPLKHGKGEPINIPREEWNAVDEADDWSR